MKNGCMKKGIRLWLLGMIFALCLFPAIPGRAEKLEEISYEENHTFHNGTIGEIENQWAVSYLQNHTETSFEVNCNKNDIIKYVEELCDGYFTCKVVEDGITYTEVPLFVAMDLSDFDTRSTEKQEIQLQFTTLEGLTFSDECASSFTMKFKLRPVYEESVEIDYFPEEMVYKRNWLVPVQSKDESENAAAKLQQQITDAFGAAYGLSLFRQFARHIAAEVIVRDKENAFIWQGFYDTQRIGGSYTHIRVCFNFSCRIYITHDGDIFVLLSDFFDSADIYHMCHRTVCVLIRHDNAFSRIQYLCTLSHKGNTTE